jgi:hypothetical protein
LPWTYLKVLFFMNHLRTNCPNTHARPTYPLMLAHPLPSYHTG